MSKITTGLFTSEKDYWETPKDLFDKLNEDYRFTLDPCATDENHKCEKYYTVKDNGLTKSWKNERVYVNPPYGSEIKDWAKKMNEEFKVGGCNLIVALLPARTDTDWFHRYIYGVAELHFLRGRVKFELDGKQTSSAPFPSMVAIFKRNSWEDQRRKK